jgi:dTDP-4-amino-4,6-dideoxygalactose transaminase
LPVYRHPFHNALGLNLVEEFPNAEGYYHGCLSLPLFQELSDEEVERVITAVTEVSGA